MLNRSTNTTASSAESNSAIGIHYLFDTSEPSGESTPTGFTPTHLTQEDRQGRSQEFSFTEARLKGKGASNAGGLGGTAPQKLTQYIKVTFSILLNSYDNTMA